MKLLSVEELKRGLERVLEEVRHEGSVHIRDAEGRHFVLTHTPSTSPLAVKGVPLQVSLSDILEAIHEGRRESSDTSPSSEDTPSSRGGDLGGFVIQRRRSP